MLRCQFRCFNKRKKIKNRIKLNGTQMDFILVLLQFAAMKIIIIFVIQGGLEGGVALASVFNKSRRRILCCCCCCHCVLASILKD